MLLLLLNLAITAYLTGVIWTVQLVHYPSFALVPAAGFPAFHRAHLKRMGWVVMAPMVGELLLAGAWTWQARTAPALGALALVGFIWAVTFLVSVPLHNRLAADGWSYAAVYGLVRTNWLRTLAWTLRLGLLGWVLLGLLP
ncbi:hypothetical protein [Hymenobacter jeollabukensis]|uniref:DUF1772 domain-containing protein n=1 Tax=Hymenobacter jeollabukensis TaxID=2025313 RepID=A0A5R8WUD1_9BACT|nr:hypothetical protein [Hymenobacter jeollabukensis]TLM95337.1 hypothetical protein FDY95_05990 [Hymenobacter jeollabukensis]